jgi:6-phosphogluconolactonase
MLPMRHISRRLACSTLFLTGAALGYSKKLGAYARPQKGKELIYVGTYSKGIYGFHYDVQTANLEPAGLLGEVQNPSFLILHPNHQYLYAVSELTGDDNPIGGVASFAINPQNGSLRLLNKRSSEGSAPCHLALDKTCKMLMVANYVTGTVSSFPILEDGSLGEVASVMKASGSSINKKRQDGPHAHEVVVSADNRFAFVPDLGLDEIRIYKTDPSTAKLTPNDPPSVKIAPGSGPRHLVFSGNEKFAYLISELLSTVTVFSYNAQDGSMKELQTVSTLPADIKDRDGAAEIKLDSAGRYLYASNRGYNSIAVFSVNKENGMLTEVQIEKIDGKMPRYITLDPEGEHLLVANQKTDNIATFSVDQNTGKITPTGRSVSLSSPVCLAFLPNIK